MKYSGGCHCGAVRFEVEMIVNQAVSCNCSICSKRGYLLAFTLEENFKLLSGENAITDYQFGKKNVHHFFCSICGVGSFGKGISPDGSIMRAINLRCLDNLNLDTVSTQIIDGRSF